MVGGRAGADADRRRELRREALLDAALALFAADGYSAVSIERLCQHARVGTRGFYELFDSRESCYLALMHRCVDRLKATMLTAVENAPPGEGAATTHLLRSFATLFSDDPRVALVLFGQGSATSPVVERERRDNRRWAAWLIATIWSHFDDGERAPHGLLVGVVGGLFDIVADWAAGHDGPPSFDPDALYASMAVFYAATRTGSRARTEDT